MSRFLVRRVAFYLVTAWIAITLNFLLPRLMPGDPAEALISQMSRTMPLTPEQAAAIRQMFGGTQRPLWDQYLDYLGRLTRLDFGVSTSFYPQPVSEVVGGAIWWTVILIGTTTVLAFLVGTGLGIVVGGRPGSRLDSILTPVSTFLGSLPYFWVALLAVLVFSMRLKWFPISGGWDADIPVGFTPEFIGSAVQFAVLPACTILLASFSGWLFGMRNMMITTASEDYVLLGAAKGLKPRRVLFSYQARNAILPSVAGFATSIGAVVGGSLLTEVVFVYPGVGTLMFKAVGSLDYPLMQALFLVISLSVLAANFIADSVYGLLDPRAREVR
ncbi:ABC transporter permease [Nonomuraea sp. NPDC050536]|uniref:ABC transporter permease n=1 Tax=Nonomuraea sp. NPDC050536 TaxID=3364366 RepID=UPI0037C4F398